MGFLLAKYFKNFIYLPHILLYLFLSNYPWRSQLFIFHNIILSLHHLRKFQTALLCHLAEHFRTKLGNVKKKQINSLGLLIFFLIFIIYLVKCGHEHSFHYFLILKFDHIKDQINNNKEVFISSRETGQMKSLCWAHTFCTIICSLGIP